MGWMGNFYDLEKGLPIGNVIRRNNGDEIVFDLWHEYDEVNYTVTLRRNNNSIYTGVATCRESSDVAELTCRVYEDREQGELMIFGSKWKNPGDSTKYTWMVTISAE